MAICGTWTAQEAISWGVYGDESSIGKRTELPEKLREFQDTQRLIRDGIADGKLDIHGLHAPMSSQNCSRTPLKHQEFVDHKNMHVDISGETVPIPAGSNRNIPKRYNIVFDSAQIRSLLPVPNPALKIFFHNYFLEHPRAKRENAISDCRAANPGVTVRQAKDALRELEPGIRRTRGDRDRPRTPSLEQGPAAPDT